MQFFQFDELAEYGRQAQDSDDTKGYDAVCAIIERLVRLKRAPIPQRLTPIEQRLKNGAV